MSAEREAGFAALQKGQIDEAIEQLEMACRNNINDYDAHLYLGAAYGQAKRNLDAINILTKAVELQPANAQARYNLGIAMEAGGYPEQAAQVIQQAVSLQPDYPKAQEALQRLQSGQSSAPGASASQQQPTAQQQPYVEPIAQQPAYGQQPVQQPGFGQPTAQEPLFGRPLDAPQAQQPPPNTGYNPPPYGAQPPNQAGQYPQAAPGPLPQGGSLNQPSGYTPPGQAYNRPAPTPYSGQPSPYQPGQSYATPQSCSQATTSLVLSIIGLVCCGLGFIFGPIAIFKANEAKNIIANNPGMTGSGTATAGMVIGIIATVISVGGLIVRFTLLASLFSGSANGIH